MDVSHEKVKHHLSVIVFLVHARTLRREACLPYYDLSARIWWHMRQLRGLKGKAAHVEI